MTNYTLSAAGLPARTNVQRQVAKASITSRRYTTIHLILHTIHSRIKGNTSAISRALRSSSLKSRTTRTWNWMLLRLVFSLILPFKMSLIGRLPSTQRNLPAEQTRFGLRTPPDPHVDRSAQSLRKPWEPGLQRVPVPQLSRDGDTRMATNQASRTCSPILAHTQ